MFLFFDTETTGLPRYWNAPLEDLDNWPRLVQLAWILADDKGREIEGGNTIIKPDGFLIPAEASAVHGITTERALAEGLPLKKVLRQFSKAVDTSKILVAHNISFDEKIMGAEFLRQRVRHKMEERARYCTMHSSTEYCGIETKYGYKWPKLTELHQKLFAKEFDNAHDALADVRACSRCFYELMERGIL